jgi:hypothetical protein
VANKFDYDALHAHCRAKLPKYAVPVFLRIMGNITPMHNNKQNKTPLKKDGIDLTKISASNKAGDPPDRMLWCPNALGRPGLESSEDQRSYVDFKWEDLHSLKAVVPKL